MIDCTCFVQADQTPNQRRSTLEASLSGFVEQAFGLPSRIRWIPVASGDGFTAARPSTASVVAINAPEPLASARRETLLRELAALWAAGADCGLDDVVAVISDPN